MASKHISTVANILMAAAAKQWMEIATRTFSMDNQKDHVQ